MEGEGGTEETEGDGGSEEVADEEGAEAGRIEEKEVEAEEEEEDGREWSSCWSANMMDFSWIGRVSIKLLFSIVVNKSIRFVSFYKCLSLSFLNEVFFFLDILVSVEKE